MDLFLRKYSLLCQAGSLNSPPPVLSSVFDISVFYYYDCPFPTELLRRLENILLRVCDVLQVFPLMPCLNLPLTTSPHSSPIPTLLLILLQPRQPVSCASDATLCLLRQGLFTCNSLYLDCSFVLCVHGLLPHFLLVSDQMLAELTGLSLVTCKSNSIPSSGSPLPFPNLTFSRSTYHPIIPCVYCLCVVYFFHCNMLHKGMDFAYITHRCIPNTKQSAGD